MAFGLGVLGLAAPLFWALTPRELDAALRGRLGERPEAAAPLARTDLLALMQQFPDIAVEREDDHEQQ